MSKEMKVSGETKKVQTKTPQKKNETVIYVGPGIPGVIEYGAIFNNGLPKKVEEFMKELPIISSLIVGIDRLPEARNSINNCTGAVYACYKSIEEYKKKGE